MQPDELRGDIGPTNPTPDIVLHTWSAVAGERSAQQEDALVSFLIDRGRIDHASVERARRIQSQRDTRITHLLVQLGLVSERDVAHAIAAVTGLRIVTMTDLAGALGEIDGVSERFLREARVLPISATDTTIDLAIADPLDPYPVSAIKLATGKRIVPCVAIPAQIEAAFSRRQSGQATAASVGDGGDSDEALETDVERLRDLASEAPVVRYVNQLVSRATELRASDIHIEPDEARLRVRFRIDGVLRDADPVPQALKAAVVSRIKIMARLNIAERRLPQDGRIKLVIRGIPIDLRVATVPTVHGESIVLRILDRTSVALDFDALGIADAVLDRYLGIVDRPHGIVLMTGPTGSGKTTSLYASLLGLNRAERKIVTVEDPVEYQIEGINQIQVKPSIDLTFANVLRSVLRHDPDIIMVGEIRDRETAEIAIQAALTGHLVLSTLHTNNAASSITRLLDMGIDGYLLTSTINGAAAQRLVRRLCRECREPYEPSVALCDRLGLARFGHGHEPRLYRAVGCAACGSTGYVGRTAILETLVMTEAIRKLILEQAEVSEIQHTAVAEGMLTMHGHGLMKALAGETTIEEVAQVTRDN